MNISFNVKQQFSPHSLMQRLFLEELVVSMLLQNKPSEISLTALALVIQLIQAAVEVSSIVTFIKNKSQGTRIQWLLFMGWH